MQLKVVLGQHGRHVTRALLLPSLHKRVLTTCKVASSKQNDRGGGQEWSAKKKKACYDSACFWVLLPPKESVVHKNSNKSFLQPNLLYCRHSYTVVFFLERGPISLHSYPAGGYWILKIWYLYGKNNNISYRNTMNTENLISKWKK
jgi:hypothetical protein